MRNVGNATTDSVVARLRSGHPLLRITDSLARYGTVPPDSVVVNRSDPFALEVDAAMPIETRVPMTLIVSGTGYADTMQFNLTVGELRAIDPIPDNSNPPRYWCYDDGDAGYPERPEFSWIEINNLGTRLTLSDDQTVTIDLPPGFVWRFYGNVNTQLSICGNGWVAPGYTTLATYTNTALPNASMPGMVAVNWDDLYPPTGGGVWYWHDAANRRFIVEYDSVAYYANRAVFDKFQFVLYDTSRHTPTGDNVFLLQYLTANGYSSSTVGSQDPTASIAIQYLFDNSYHRGAGRLQAGRALKFTTVEPSTGINEPRTGNLVVRRAQAYPNPFAGSTRLVAQLPVSGPAACRIYDNSGRVVRELAVEGGRTSWDGCDGNGRPAPPGIYFCQFVNGDEDAWGKLVLTR